MIVFENVNLIAKQSDYRPAIVMDNVHDALLTDIHYIEPGKKSKKQLVSHDSSIKRQ